jgi:hypothetical protein
VFTGTKFYDDYYTPDQPDTSATKNLIAERVRAQCASVFKSLTAK